MNIEEVMQMIRHALSDAACGVGSFGERANPIEIRRAIEAYAASKAAPAPARKWERLTDDEAAEIRNFHGIGAWYECAKDLQEALIRKNGGMERALKEAALDALKGMK